MATTSMPGVTLATALDRSEPLALLMQRLAQSRQRFEVVAPLLPQPLLGTVRAGPLDHESWTLLAAHSASAAKLRQLLPNLQAALAQSGLPPLVLKVKIAARSA
jgi:hypothetical protein